MRVPIAKSDYSEEFIDIESESLLLLTKNDALDIWTSYIDEHAASYFQLQDENWVIQGRQENLGRWLEAYNDENSSIVENKLNEVIPWENESIVWFCISKALIIETSWKEFKKLWIHFLECEDDCPIIISKNKKGYAILFKPIGDFTKITAVP